MSWRDLEEKRQKVKLSDQKLKDNKTFKIGTTI